MTKLLIPSLVHEKMMLYAKFAPGEISGLGFVSFQGSDIVVDDVFIFEQKASHADTTLDTDALHEFIINKTVEDPECIDKLRLWWHSHAELDAYFSVTDEQTIDSLASGPFVSVVVNKRRAIVARLDMKEPVRLSVPLSVELFTEVDDDFTRALKDEVSVKVKASPLVGIITGKKRRHHKSAFRDPFYYDPWYEEGIEIEDELMAKFMADGCCDIDGGCCGNK